MHLVVREIGFPNPPGRARDSDNAGRRYDIEVEVRRFILPDSAQKYCVCVVHITICASAVSPLYILEILLSSMYLLWTNCNGHRIPDSALTAASKRGEVENAAFKLPDLTAGRPGEGRYEVYFQQSPKSPPRLGVFVSLQRNKDRDGWADCAPGHAHKGSVGPLGLSISSWTVVHAILPCMALVSEGIISLSAAYTTTTSIPP